MKCVEDGDGRCRYCGQQVDALETMPVCEGLCQNLREALVKHPPITNVRMDPRKTTEPRKSRY